MAAPIRKVIRTEQVLAMTSLSRGSLYRFVGDGQFPAPLQLGPRLLGWYEDEVAEWLETRTRGLHSSEDARRLRSVPRPTRVPA